MSKWKMGTVRRVLFTFNFPLAFAGCFSAPSSSMVPVEVSLNTTSRQANFNQTSVLNQTQYRDSSLDSAMIEGGNYIIDRLPSGAKVAIVNIQSLTANLTNYIIDSLLTDIVNRDSFFVIERSELSAIQKEQEYQLSGEVSDETAVSIGHQLGAQFIITGSILPVGERYSFRLKIINVETAQITGTKIFQITKDNTLIALLEPPREQQDVKPIQNTPQTVINNNSVTNNSTTTINGDVYINKPNGFWWE